MIGALWVALMTMDDEEKRERRKIIRKVKRQVLAEINANSPTQLATKERKRKWDANYCEYCDQRVAVKNIFGFRCCDKCKPTRKPVQMKEAERG